MSKCIKICLLILFFLVFSSSSYAIDMNLTLDDNTSSDSNISNTNSSTETSNSNTNTSSTNSSYTVSGLDQLPESELGLTNIINIILIVIGILLILLSIAILIRLKN